MRPEEAPAACCRAYGQGTHAAAACLQASCCLQVRGQLHAVLHEDAPRLAMVSALGAMLLLPALGVTVKQDVSKVLC